MADEMFAGLPEKYQASSVKLEHQAHACCCIGPQPGFPRCPCMMRGLIQRDGRWIEPEKDLGPVQKYLEF